MRSIIRIVVLASPWLASLVLGMAAACGEGDADGDADETAVGADEPPPEGDSQPSHHLVVSPATVDFGVVPADTTASAEVELSNLGVTPLAVDRVRFLGHFGYSVSINGFTTSVTAESASGGVRLPAPLTIAGGSSARIEVSYRATGPEAAKGTIVFLSDDISDNVELTLLANLSGPCIEVAPSRVSFGAVRLGATVTQVIEVRSCGDADLEISEIGIVDDDAGVFRMDASPDATLPASLSPGASLNVPVRYRPVALAEAGPDGVLEVDHAVLRVRSNAFMAEVDIELEGWGTDDSCPTTSIVVAEGSEVLPQTILHLSATTSSASEAVSYEWSVSQPIGSVSMLSPSANVAAPTFEANVAGTYVFDLTVDDERGTSSCPSARYHVHVVPDAAIHIELLWNTPGDLDQSDIGGDQIYFSVGSDLDLHLLHPNALGQYFDWTYDCYWDNIDGWWSTPGSGEEDPRLDRDDTDGAGPENTNFRAPEEGLRYQIGVHYWNDWGYGESWATVRIYVFGELVEEWADVKLVNDDMWDTHTIDWPSGVVTRLGDGSPHIVPKFRGF